MQKTIDHLSSHEKESLKRILRLEVSSKQHENDISIIKGDRAEIRRIIESIQIKVKDNTARFNILEKKV